jgi:hypothetical protein
VSIIDQDLKHLDMVNIYIHAAFEMDSALELHDKSCIYSKCCNLASADMTWTFHDH